MRILLWYWGRRGGGAQFALCLARAMAPGGLALSVSSLNELIDDFRALPVPRQEVSTYRNRTEFIAGFARLPTLAKGLSRFAAAETTTVVISAMPHLWTPFIAGSLARAGISYIPVIHDADPHPGDPNLLFHWRLQRELAAARAVIVFSDTVARKISAHRPNLPLIRLPLGAHLPHGSAIAEVQSDFLFFGRIRRYKGLNLLRDAWVQIQTIHPHATLKIVGEGDLDELAPNFVGLPGVTIEQRWVPDSEIAPLLASAKALVLPYFEASQSGVLPLALALGVPVVATAVGGLVEQVQDGVDGLICLPQADSLSAAMIQMLNPHLHARLREGAQAAGVQLLDWQKQAQTLRTGISDIMGR